jgi:regulator of protease activity HflC (stomatin/prohibitin superfamily)
MDWLEAIVDFFWVNNQTIAVVLAAIAGSAQRVVRSGERGLRFTLGRATNEVGPGFHFMLPWLQTIDIVQDRAKTLDIPDQRVTTHDGIVLAVDCSVVYRIVDIRKALIEIDNLERGMTHLLPIAVQQVLGHLSNDGLRASDGLDAQLDQRLSALVSAWGVQLESARLTSIAPSRRSLRITQLGQQVEARRTSTMALSSVGSTTALGLVGRTSRYVQRGQSARLREAHNRWLRHWIRALGRRGMNRHATVRALRATQTARMPRPSRNPLAGPVRLLVLVAVAIGLAIPLCVGLLF